MPDLELVDVALGGSPADLVVRGGRLVNVFTERRSGSGRWWQRARSLPRAAG